VAKKALIEVDVTSDLSMRPAGAIITTSKEILKAAQ
jgi:hypothetical protein